MTVQVVPFWDVLIGQTGWMVVRSTTLGVWGGDPSVPRQPPLAPLCGPTFSLWWGFSFLPQFAIQEVKTTTHANTSTPSPTRSMAIPIEPVARPTIGPYVPNYTAYQCVRP